MYLEHFSRLVKSGKMKAGRDIAPLAFVTEVEDAIGCELPRSFRNFLMAFPRTQSFYDPMLLCPAGRSFHGGQGAGLAVCMILGDAQQAPVELLSMTRTTMSDRSRYGAWAKSFIVIGESIWGDAIMLAVSGDDAGIVGVFNVWGFENENSDLYRQHLTPLALSFEEFILSLEASDAAGTSR